jgi:hypothetical protein
MEFVQLINLAFPVSAAEALFDYLGEGFNIIKLLKNNKNQA